MQIIGREAGFTGPRYGGGGRVRGSRGGGGGGGVGGAQEAEEVEEAERLEEAIEETGILRQRRRRSQR